MLQIEGICRQINEISHDDHESVILHIAGLIYLVNRGDLWSCRSGSPYGSCVTDTEGIGDRTPARAHAKTVGE